MAGKGEIRKKSKGIILIPTDFSEVAEYAIGHGLMLAQLLDDKICLLHVVTRMNDPAGKEDPASMETVNRKLLEYKTFYEKKYPVSIEVLALEGNLFQVLRKVATGMRARLMIMGTHGKQGLQYLFGSYALKVVLDSPCPVIVVQDRPSGEGYRNIVLPVMAGAGMVELAGRALLMHELFGSRICLLKSMEHETGMHSQLSQVVGQVTGLFDTRKVSWEMKTADGATDFPSQVIAHAKTMNAGLMLVASLTGEETTGFTLSSWNERLMFNEALIPVMCVNPS